MTKYIPTQITCIFHYLFHSYNKESCMLHQETFTQQRKKKEGKRLDRSKWSQMLVMDLTSKEKLLAICIFTSSKPLGGETLLSKKLLQQISALTTEATGTSLQTPNSIYQNPQASTLK